VKVRVMRAGRRVFNRVPRLHGRAVNIARDGASQSKTIRAAVTIDPAAPPLTTCLQEGVTP
jgi:hypothetical protein